MREREKRQKKKKGGESKEKRKKGETEGRTLEKRKSENEGWEKKTSLHV